MSVARKALTGGLWLGGTSWIGYFASFGGRIILARLLAPDDFGTYALALSVSELLFLFFFGFSFRLAAINLSDE